ncbi:tRNA (5-methylaminomethyl-2-thiouridine)(34)-methyltransferase MnmD [Odoribacter sp. OttesenSCG-928-J03]|nr:tRNA (5-methylaminomethyl-2-thiouridine)(34)-methyltransferase MnmD [Odoribacter sp. OttesenSCG-928-J03]
MLKRELKITEDGSHTLYVPELNEHYHSTYGAVQEAQHVYIKAGLEYCCGKEIKILEAGFGTGLNTLLSLIYAVTHDIHIVYHSFEKYPLTFEEVEKLNYAGLFSEEFSKAFSDIHICEWGKEVKINDHFTLYKHQADFSTVDFEAYFDLVYFDAFNPDVQPGLWSKEILGLFCKALKKEGILTTYCVKGIVKQALRSLGCSIERLPGPPGKREMLRAVNHSFTSI